jgi:predicted RNase H-like HicB family nuclease
MNEIVFSVEVDEEGGYVAVSELGDGAIVTQGDTLPELKFMITDAIEGYFFDAPDQKPRVVRLHFVKDEVFSL